MCVQYRCQCRQGTGDDEEGLDPGVVAPNQGTLPALQLELPEDLLQMFVVFQAGLEMLAVSLDHSRDHEIE